MRAALAARGAAHVLFLVVACGDMAARAAPDAGAAPAAPLIDSADRARRLARAIASDIILYHQPEVDEARATGKVPASLRAVIEEGRVLFERRVEKSFAGLYAAAVEELIMRKSPLAPAAPVIDDAERARRLARAIAEDIERSNDSAVAEARRTGKVSDKLEGEIAQGRALFEKRTSKPYLGIYAATVDEIVFRKTLPAARP
jgi:hypothetical protein